MPTSLLITQRTNKMTFAILEVVDKQFALPLKKTPKLSLRLLQFFYSWTSVVTIWYIFFGAWFIRGAGIVYGIGTIFIALLLTIAFFYESDGRGWKNFATLCVICSIPRLFFTPIYAIASIQTAGNGTSIPDYHEAFHNMGFYNKGHMEKDISIIWFIHYYSFMLIMVSIQRVLCRKAVEEKKAKIYSETVKNDELKNVHNEQSVGPMHI
uniref:ABC2_membrane domain-containing protein n=2 Tax=Caenorhabditis tropicalis TaxID=1561998 RepID=A0A1I7T3C2_9PELO